LIEFFGRNPTGHRAVRHWRTVYLGGVTAADRSGGIGAQTVQVLDKIAQILTDAGSDKVNLLSATVYLRDMDMKTEMHESWIAWFGATLMPARATIGGVDLGPSVLIEVVAIASCPD
jgi:enamine deaminase RidA (YjgF/YER057c/UK114 family)